MALVLQEVLAVNDVYAASFNDKGKLAMSPARRFAILSCLDAGSTPPNTPAQPKATPM
jgi:carbonic anhydrase